MLQRTSTVSGFVIKYLALGMLCFSTAGYLAHMISASQEVSMGVALVGFAFLLACSVTLSLLGIDLYRILTIRELLPEDRQTRIQYALHDAGISYAMTAANSSTHHTSLVNSLRKGSHSETATLLHMSGDGWGYSEYKYIRVISVNGWQYKPYVLHFSLTAIDLPRKLPHIVFDSITAYGRQFGFNFDRDQQISLGEAFDQYFDTYFPAHYQIDLLSIITPEIMELLIELSAFDIEIKDNKLYIINSLKSPEKTSYIIQQGLRFRAMLASNMRVYSDIRLTGNNRTSVHVHGSKIQKNFIGEAVISFLIGLGAALAAILAIVAMINNSRNINNESIIFAGCAILVWLVCMFVIPISTLIEGRKERIARRRTSGK